MLLRDFIYIRPNLYAQSFLFWSLTKPFSKWRRFSFFFAIDSTNFEKFRLLMAKKCLIKNCFNNQMPAVKLQASPVSLQKSKKRLVASPPCNKLLLVYKHKISIKERPEKINKRQKPNQKTASSAILDMNVSWIITVWTQCNIHWYQFDTILSVETLSLHFAFFKDGNKKAVISEVKMFCR